MLSPFKIPRDCTYDIPRPCFLVHETKAEVVPRTCQCNFWTLLVAYDFSLARQGVGLRRLSKRGSIIKVNVVNQRGGRLRRLRPKSSCHGLLDRRICWNGA